MYPKISIITPSFNQGNYLEETIRSVVDQKYPNLEFIIIDGGSTDITLEVIKRYGSQLSYWVSESDKGQTDAINKGFTKCSGEIVNWLNSDDYYEKDALWKVAETFRRFPEAEVVCGKEWGFLDGNPAEKISHPGSQIKTLLEETIFTGIIDQPCTFFKRAVISSFFPLDQSLRYVMDRELWWRYLLKNGQEKIVQIEDVLTWFRLHPISKSVAEGHAFEKEFDRLRFSLLQELQAPEILLSQISARPVAPLAKQWEMGAVNKEKLLSEFAYHYALMAYVQEDLPTSKALMNHVKKWSGPSIKKDHKKLWVKTNLLPSAVLYGVKKLKQLCLA